VCDTLAAVGSQGALFAKNSDRPAGEIQIIEANRRRVAGAELETQYLTIPDAGAAALIGSRPSWLWGLEHGVNEHRVAVGNEMLWTSSDPRAAPPALIGMDLVRLALERATDADAAVEVITDLLARYGQGGAAEADPPKAYFSSFLIADPHRVWVLETSASTWAARPVGPGAGSAISNRITLRDDWTIASPDVAPGTDFDRFRRPGSPTDHADRRLARSRPVVEHGADSLSPADLVGLLRDHGGERWGRPTDPVDQVVEPPPADAPSPTGVTVCMHLRDDQTTNAAMVALLPADPDAPTRAWVALGSPCASVFVPVFAPFEVPTDLSFPETWHAFEALRPAVEGPDGGGALLAVRSVLGPLERELWEEAEACAPPGRDAERAAFVATIGPRLRDAFRRIGTE
jgi:secernin